MTSKHFISVMANVNESQDNQSKIKYLEGVIIYCSQKYYSDNDSPVSDNEFDIFVVELKKLDPTNHLLSAVAYGYKAGDKTAKHPYHSMHGIDDKLNVSEDAVIDNGKSEYGPKLDGCSGNAYYTKGRYYRAITRGDVDGYGKDITRSLFHKVPHTISNFTGYVRVENVVTYSNFRKYFPPDKSIRNIASGIIGAKSEKPLLPYVDAVPVAIYDADKDATYHMGSVEFDIVIQDFKHKVYPLIVSADGDTKVQLGLDLLDKLRNDYPVDGYVCYKDGDILRAYKFDGEILDVSVLYVEGKTKPTTRIQPRIFIEPTEISDCVCRKVTGKSYDAIFKGKVGKGAIIEIIRSGEVVPNWTKNVIKDSNDVWIPRCSYGCDEKYVKRNGANVYCTNPDCPSILDGTAEKLIRYFAPKGFRTDMLEEMFEYFDSKDKSILESILFDIKNNNGIPYTIGTTDHQHKMINQTISEMKKRKMSLYNLVSICSIEAFGKTLSIELEKQLQDCSDVNVWLKDKKDFTSEHVNNCKARDSWRNRHDLLCQVMDVFEIVVPVHKPEGENGTVCISGALPSGTKKKDFANVIESKGFTWVEKMKKDTTILISSLPNSGKSQKARKNGTKIMSESEFIEL